MPSETTKGFPVIESPLFWIENFKYNLFQQYKFPYGLKISCVHFIKIHAACNTRCIKLNLFVTCLLKSIYQRKYCWSFDVQTISFFRESTHRNLFSQKEQWHPVIHRARTVVAVLSPAFYTCFFYFIKIILLVVKYSSPSSVRTKIR